MKYLKNYAPALGWGIFIFILSIIPGKDIPKIESPWDLIKMDKIVHMTMYGILAWQILRGSHSKNEKEDKTYDAKYYVALGAKAVLFACFMGFFLELIQENFCKDRAFEWYDGIANTIGALLATAVFYFYQSKRQAINR
jgi:VanZ family protein